MNILTIHVHILIKIGHVTHMCPIFNVQFSICPDFEINKAFRIYLKTYQFILNLSSYFVDG